MGSLAHGDDHLKIAETFRKGILARDPFVKRLDTDVSAQALPIGQRKSHGLIVIENGYSRHR
jgi:hypothetical protein